MKLRVNDIRGAVGQWESRPTDGNVMGSLRPSGHSTEGRGVGDGQQ